MFLGIASALLLGCGYLGARLLGLRGFWERFFGTAILAMAQVVVTTLTLGRIPGFYRPIPLTIITALVFAGLLTAAILRGKLQRERMPAEERPYIRVFLVAALVTLPLWLWEFFNGLLLPPVYWDELLYHLVAPALWAQHGSYYQIALGNPFVNAYPWNVEMLSGWTMAMTKTDIWGDLLGLPFVFLGLGVVIAFCRKLRVRPWNSFWAALLFVVTPMVIFHSKSSYVDMPISVLFGLGSYFLLDYAEDGRRAPLLAGAVTMGIIVGAKYSGPYMALAGLFPILYRFYRIRHDLFKAKWWPALLQYVLPIIILGGYYYIRNWIVFGNPVYPMRASFLNVTIFDGQFKTDAFKFTANESSWLTLGKALLETEPHPQMDSFYAGFGPQFLVFALPSLVIYLFKAKDERARIGFTWLLPLLLAVATLPAKFPRYLPHINLFLLPFAAWVLDRLKRFWALPLKAAAIGIAAYCVVLAAPIYAVEPAHYERAARSIWTANWVGIGSWSYWRLHHMDLAMDGPLRIAGTTNTHLTYPQLGKDWRNQLTYIKPTGKAAWTKGILASKADVYIMDPLFMKPREEPWVKSQPKIFRLVFQDYWLKIYVIIPGDRRHQDFLRRYLKEEAPD